MDSTNTQDCMNNYFYYLPYLEYDRHINLPSSNEEVYNLPDLPSPFLFTQNNLESFPLEPFSPLVDNITMEPFSPVGENFSFEPYYYPSSPTENVFDATTMEPVQKPEYYKTKDTISKCLPVLESLVQDKKETNPQVIEVLAKAAGRIFKCPHENCLKRFKRTEHLKRHFQSIHTEIRPYRCAFPSCEKAFARSDNLRQHIKVHNNPKYKNEPVKTEK